MLIDSDSIFHDEVENSYLGGGAKSYDDRGLWCYQLNNDSQVATIPEAVERYTNPIAIGYTNFRIL